VIPDGPADKAGIKRGDVIVSFDGQPIVEMENLPKIVAATPPEKTVDVEVMRNAKKKVLKVQIAILKDGGPPAVEKADPLGLKVQDITPEIAQSLKLEDQDGVLVADVAAGEAAAEAGIRRGDVIAELNRKPVKSLADYDSLTAGLQPGSSVLFLIKRGGTTIYIAVKVG
jgi:serine protease Do